MFPSHDSHVPWQILLWLRESAGENPKPLSRPRKWPCSRTLPGVPLSSAPGMAKWSGCWEGDSLKGNWLAPWEGRMLLGRLPLGRNLITEQGGVVMMKAIGARVCSSSIISRRFFRGPHLLLQRKRLLLHRTTPRCLEDCELVAVKAATFRKVGAGG